MNKQRRRFHTTGPVVPEENYFVKRQDELNEFLGRIQQGKYIVIFAPRQTGKTTFFYHALNVLEKNPDYIPISLDFEIYSEAEPEEFYRHTGEEIIGSIRRRLQAHDSGRGVDVQQLGELDEWLAAQNIIDHFSFERFFGSLHAQLPSKRVCIIIDEFDGIPQKALRNFLYTLRKIYNAKKRSAAYNYIHSVGIVGVKSIAQLNFDHSISPFNIQDEFQVKNFTLSQVQELLGQYTAEVERAFEFQAIKLIHEKTAGQPFLVNRLAQILTEELNIPSAEDITVEHFQAGYKILVKEDNPHFDTLVKNIKRNPKFKDVLLSIINNEEGVEFNRRDEVIKELTTYGVIREQDGFCVIDNPSYQIVIIDTFKPRENGLENQYLPEDVRFTDYVTLDRRINMNALLSNFCDFIKRVGFRILQVMLTPQEFLGQYLLIGYLDTFVRQIGAHIYPEVPTGRGRMDIIILYESRKYIIETKLWKGEKHYQDGKKQLAQYLQREGAEEGYYVVFDYRKRQTKERREIENIDEKTILSYCIPILSK